MVENKRINWPDYAKGIGIFLVVLGHLIRSLQNRSILSSHYWSELDTWIYSFHMPLFFFLSGLFFSKTLKLSFYDFLSSRLKTIAYPYFVWSTIQSLLQIFVSRWINTSMSFSELLAITVNPVMQFWFLYALFMCQMLFYILAKALNKWQILVIAIFLKLISPTILPLPWIVLDYLFIYFVWFVAGSLSFNYLKIKLKSSNSKLLILSLSLLAINITSQFIPNHMQIKSSIAVISGSLMVITLSAVLDAKGLLCVLKAWGQNSLEIYVAHTICMSAARVILMKIFHIHDAWIHIIVGMSAGIYGPLVMIKIANHLNMGFIFRFPKMRDTK